jgi:RimJ/RimL family protein N-acetyltransferase
MTPALLTERLLLRPLEHEDAAPLAHVLGAERVARGLCDVPLPFTTLHAAARILMARAREMSGTDAAWAVEDAHGDLIGFVGLTRENADDPAQVGFALDPAQWGRGYAREALAAVCDWVGRDGFAPALMAEVPDEPGCHALLSGLGFARRADRVRFSEATATQEPVAIYAKAVTGDVAPVTGGFARVA